MHANMHLKRSKYALKTPKYALKNSKTSISNNKTERKLVQIFNKKIVLRSYKKYNVLLTEIFFKFTFENSIFLF